MRPLLLARVSETLNATTIEIVESQLTPHTALSRLRLRTERGERTVWLKEYLRKPEDAAKEYLFLQQATRASLRVVEPLCLFTDCGALLTRHADGDALSDRVRRALDGHGGDAHLRETAEECAACGNWLARWHTATSEETPGETHGVVGCIAARLPPDGRERIVSLLRRLTIEPAVGVVAHGDFGPHNILIAGGDPIVFDPSFPDDLDPTPFEDLGRFQACVLDSHAPTFTSRTSRELTRSFLNGYNAAAIHRIRSSSPTLLLFTAKHLLQNLFDRRRRTTPIRALIGRYERWLRNEISALDSNSRARRRSVALLIGDQLDGPLRLFVAARHSSITVIESRDDCLFALDPPIELPRSANGEVVVVGSRWAQWARRRGVDVAHDAIPMLRQRYTRVVGFDQSAGFELEFDPDAVSSLDAVIKSNGILPADAGRLNLSLPTFATETLPFRRLLRSRSIASPLERAARSAADQLFARVAPEMSAFRPPRFTAHFLGALTNVQRASALRLLRDRGVAVRGGIVGVPSIVIGLDGDNDAAWRHRLMNGLRSEGLTAQPLSRTAYKLSMLDCKAVLSIAGHGEISYRMAEGWAMRRVVVCQDLSAALTLYPFENGRNVVFCRTDLSDLADIMEDIECNFRRYLPIAEQGFADWNAWSAQSMEMLPRAFAPLWTDAREL